MFKADQLPVLTEMLQWFVDFAEKNSYELKMLASFGSCEKDQFSAVNFVCQDGKITPYIAGN